MAGEVERGDAMGVSERIAARVREDFRSEDVEEALRELATAYDGQGSDRMQAAVVLRAEGDLKQLKRDVRESHIDFRDVLMYSGMEHGNWPEVLEREFPVPDERGRPKVVSARVVARVRKDFRAKEVEEALRELATTYSRGQAWNRMQAAVVLKAAGDLRRLKRDVRESHNDFRGVLMGSGMENGDWPEVLEREFPEPDGRRRR